MYRAVHRYSKARNFILRFLYQPATSSSSISAATITLGHIYEQASMANESRHVSGSDSLPHAGPALLGLKRNFDQSSILLIPSAVPPIVFPSERLRPCPGRALAIDLNKITRAGKKLRGPHDDPGSPRYPHRRRYPVVAFHLCRFAIQDSKLCRCFKEKRDSQIRLLEPNVLRRLCRHAGQGAERLVPRRQSWFRIRRVGLLWRSHRRGSGRGRCRHPM